MWEALRLLGVSVIIRKGGEVDSLPPIFPRRYCFELCLLQLIGVTIAFLGPGYTEQPYISPPRSVDTRAGSVGSADLSTPDPLVSTAQSHPTTAKEESSPPVVQPSAGATYIIAAAYGGTATNGGSYTQLCLSAGAASFVAMMTIWLGTCVAAVYLLRSLLGRA